MYLGIDIGGTKCAFVTAELAGGSIRIHKKEKFPYERYIGIRRKTENALLTCISQVWSIYRKYVCDGF